MNRQKRFAFLLLAFILLILGIAYFSPYRYFGNSPISVPLYNEQQTNSGILAGISTATGIFLERWSTPILTILLLLLIYVLYHIIFSHILPWLRVRRLKANEDPIEILQYMVRKIGLEKRESSQNRVRINRLNKFYDYLPEKIKNRAKIKVKDLKKYLN
jgi:hypothetical protein